MGEPYQVFEPADLPGEVVLVGEFATVSEAADAVDAGAGRTVEWRDGGTARSVPADELPAE